MGWVAASSHRMLKRGGSRSGYRSSSRGGYYGGGSYWGYSGGSYYGYSGGYGGYYGETSSTEIQLIIAGSCCIFWGFVIALGYFCQHI